MSIVLVYKSKESYHNIEDPRAVHTFTGPTIQNEIEHLLYLREAFLHKIKIDPWWVYSDR